MIKRHNQRGRQLSALGFAIIIMTLLLGDAVGLTSMAEVTIPLQPIGLNQPTSLTIGPDGSLYVCDTGNHQILRIENPTTEPTITRIAGFPGKPGFSGDGGFALNARLFEPTGIAIDPATGIMYFSDTGNNMIRHITPGLDGIVNGGPGEEIWTVLGRRTGGCLDPADVSPERFPLNQPGGISIDAFGTLFVANMGCGNILMIDPATRHFKVLGGDSTGPSDIAINPRGSLFAAMARGNRICLVTQGECFPVAGNGRPTFCGEEGPPTDLCLFGPRGLDVGILRDLEAIFVADTFNHRIRVVLRAGRESLMFTIAGSGPIGPGNGGCSGDGNLGVLARLNSPSDVAFDATSGFFVADTGNNRIRWIDTRGFIRTIVGPAFCR